jgi:ATP-dependent 26S proteasome regulatory subunit
MTFLERPSVTAADVVLPDGVLQRIRDHVVGIAEHADDLRARGQHLKRGVLLYGPPGTGKTLTVRHLLHETPQTTAVLLQGGALGLVGEAARLARAMTPSIVVLEDVDLVAAERGMFGIQPLLFEVLDALDGLDGDADVAFILTTNRADILEPALAARPGRVDLAVEIPLPDAGARRALFRVYAAGLPLSDDALDAAADRAEGVTASFAKELIRRAVLHATLQGHEVGDADLDAALTEMLEAAQGISKALFGGEGTDPGPPAGFGAEEGASFGWVASQPLAGRMFGDVAPGFGADDADEVPDTDEHDR